MRLVRLPKIATALAGLALVAAGVSAGASRAQDAVRPFTDAERAALARGALVVRTQTRQRDGLELMGGTSWQVIRQPPDVVWRMVLDTDRYPKMLPACVESHVVAHEDTTSVVYVRHVSGPVDTSYYIDTHVHAAERDFTFTLDPHRPHTIRAAWGFFTVRPYGHDSLLSYGVMADLGGGLIGGVLRPAVHETMMRVPQSMKHWVEGEGRTAYLDPAPPGLGAPSPSPAVPASAVASRPGPPPPP